MKKRLLITSIVMMLVVAVALSTATYAWFTSSNSVTANSLTMTAAINQDAALEISYSNAEGAWLTNIEAEDSSLEAFAPAAAIITASPAALVKHDSTHTGTYFSALDWKSATIINGKFNDDVANAQMYVWQDNTTPTSNKSFYIHNASTANTVANVNVTATITGSAHSFIRVAIFKNDGSDNFELYGILSNGVLYAKADPDTWTSSTKYYSATTFVPPASETNVDPGTTYATKAELEAALAAGMVYTLDSAYSKASVATSAFDTSTAVTSIITDQNICTSTIALGGLGVNDNTAGGTDEMELKVVVWMDGSALNDDTAGTAGKTASISLTFTRAAAV